MATILMSIVEHDRSDFANFSPRRFRTHLRKLQHALAHDESSANQPTAADNQTGL